MTPPAKNRAMVPPASASTLRFVVKRGAFKEKTKPSALPNVPGMDTS